MPAPATLDELLDMVRRSQVVEEKRLNAYLESLLTAPSIPNTPRDLANAMIRDGLLTNFQAQQLLQGRTRRFILANKYRLLESIGRGGMGCVYLCEHLYLRRRVAIKIMPPAVADDVSTVERFYREARAIAVLDHPNIVRCYDMERDAELHLLVMEYVDGSSLQDIVRRHGPMDIARASHYVRQAAEGLQHIHEAGLVHRDIKPGNLLLERSGTVKILDMGLARFFNDEDDDITRKHDETVLGTTDYLAPEQAIDSDVDIRADIYSLGATFYYLLAGRTPFADGTVAQKLIWHQTRQPKPVRSLRPEVAEGLAAIIERMMAKDPAARFQTPAELVNALEAWTAQPIGPPPDHEMPELCAAARGTGKTEVSSSKGTARPSSPASRLPSPPPAPATPAVVPAATSPDRPRIATPRPNGVAPKPAAPRSSVPGRPTPGPVRHKTMPHIAVAAKDNPKETSTEQAGLDTEAPMARADTEPTQARKKPASPATDPAPAQPPAAPKPARLRFHFHLSQETISMCFGAAIVLCALLVWLLLMMLR